ncbi:AsmA family protein [Asticcacaulis sp. EMRT-3]|uniref:AsmA family protein n=1 Tax=Asticcacaulis sp. EMRT-3 TaxID=3040349 RepID=UPI0024AFE2B4|nr:AsmA family protein [Asticcacaulis sp. EMRT-3]MDI7775018.1 AsmA family protein [Asticcacaulis sp. EMRT-3]
MFNARTFSQWSTERLRSLYAHMRPWPHRAAERLHRGWNATSRTVRWTAAAVIVAMLAVIIFLALPNWNWFRPALSSIVSARLHRPVRIDGPLRVHLFSFTPEASLQGLKIGEPSGLVKDAPKADLADIGGIAVRAELMPLFIGRIVLPRLQIDRPVVTLFQDAAGHANWDFSNGANKGQPRHLPLIKNFIIHDGHISMNSLSRKLRFSGTVFAREKADAGGQAFGLNGKGSLNGKVFEMQATGGPLLNVRTSVPYPFDMAVRAGETQITARGRVLHPFDLGQIDAAMTLKGGNLADLYYLTGLTLPDTPAYSLAAQVKRDDRTYTISGIDGRVGGSDLAGALKVKIATDGRPDLTGDLRSRRLDFKDLGTLFGATAANAPQAPKLSADPHATAAVRRLLPDVPLDVERVRGMDADVHYKALSVLAPHLPLRGVSLGIRLDHGLMTLDPIVFSFPQGHLEGTARIDARKAVQQDAVDFRVTHLRVQDFVPAFQGSEPLEGVISARIRAQGTGNTIHKAAASADGQFALVMPGGTVRQSLAELMGIDASKGLFMLLSKDPHQTDVRCAVANFRIQDGIMQAQQIVFDTGVVVVNGSGSINLKDESLNLAFRGQAKKFRLVRIKTPIMIGGHLTAPTFGVKIGPALAQGGIGVVLGTVSAGLAALPFVNLEGAPDANCASLLSTAHARGAPATK